MELNVDIERLIRERVGIGEYLLYWFVYNNESELFHKYYDYDKGQSWGTIGGLFQYGYIEKIDEMKPISFSNLRVTDKYLFEYIQEPIKSNSVSTWIDEWLSLFPKGIKVFGYLVRSDRNGCLNKMKIFVKTNPQFTKEIILKATKNYIDYCKSNNYSSIQMAHYFISKNKVSNLAGYCEAIKDKLDNGKINKEDLAFTVEDFIFDKSINQL